MKRNQRVASCSSPRISFPKWPFEIKNSFKANETTWINLGMLLLLSHFCRVRLCVTPETAAHQTPPPLGFSRQEHWSGLPFPSPMHESEKWKWKVKVKSLSRVQLLATPWTAAYQAPLPMGFSRQKYWSGVPLPSPKLRCSGMFYEKLMRNPEIYLNLALWAGMQIVPFH